MMHGAMNVKITVIFGVPLIKLDGEILYLKSRWVALNPYGNNLSKWSLYDSHKYI
jgi:hypothetical protein